MKPRALGTRLRAQTRPIIYAATLTACALLIPSLARSHDIPGGLPHGAMPGPAPVGVPGAMMPPPGKTVAMSTTRLLHLDGTKAGSKDVSPEWVVLNGNNPNRPPVQYRRVPLDANIRMHGFGFAHGLTPWLSVSLSTVYLNKAVRVLTFSGAAGTNRLGVRTDRTDGLGDTAVGANVRLWHGHGQMLHAGLSVSLPTGSIEERITPLMPNGMIGNARGGYTLQLGTGTYDLLPAVTYLGRTGAFGYGAAYRGRIALESENDAGYRWGDLHTVTAWVSYDFMPALTGSLRMEGSTREAIHGRDLNISGPGIGTNPLNTGGERIDVYLGMNARGMLPGVGMGRLGFEAGVPVYERTNGIHLARDWSLQFTAGISF